MIFSRPQALALCAAAVPAAAFYIRSFILKRRAVDALGTASLLHRLLRNVSPGRQKAKASLAVAGLVFLAIAMAGPRWGVRADALRLEGRDIIVAVDISDSMKARDIRPDRLGRARLELSSLLGTLSGDRVGLIAFRGSALPLVPLTTDYAAVRDFLSALEPSLIPQPGTDIGGALEAALRMIPGDGPSRAIVLLTDGEDTAGRGADAGAAAAARGVKVFPIGIGSDSGEPIPLDGGGFKKDRSGRVVMSTLDAKLLASIAEATGGTFLRSGAAEIGVERAYAEIKKMEKKEWERRLQTEMEDRYRWFLFPAFLFLLADFLLPETRRERKVRRGSAAGMIPLAVLLSGASLGAGPFERPNPAVEEGNALYGRGLYSSALQKYQDAERRLTDSPELRLNEGLSLYQLKEFPRAAEALRQGAASPDPAVRAQSLFHLGNTAFRTEKYQEAVDAYRESLLLNPVSEDAKINLELAMKKLEDRRKQKENKQDTPPPSSPKNTPDSREAGQETGKETARPRPAPGPMTPEEARQVLDTLRTQRVNIQPQKDMVKDKGIPYMEKDW